MRVSYDIEADAAYIYLTEIKKDGIAKTVQCTSLSDGMINLDFSKTGILVGIEVLNAKTRLPKDLHEMMTYFEDNDILDWPPHRRPKKE